MQGVSCRLEFLSDNEVRYRDSLEREANGRIDLSGLTWRTTPWLCDYLAGSADYLGGTTAACTRAELELLGRHLYELAFVGLSNGVADSVRECFEKAYGVFHSSFNERVNRLR